MSDSLIPYYNREVAAIRRLAAEFAEAHPKIAARLRLSAETVADPHVERLLDGVAFLSARVHHRLDDEFPELTDALLGVLYPHYLAPVPSCAIVQFTCQGDLAAPYRMQAGVAIDSEPVRQESCRFQTAYPTTLWPIEIEAARLSGLPLVAPANPRADGAVAVLRLTLKCAAPSMTFQQLGVDRLRFHVRGGSQVAPPLFELINANALSVVFADAPSDPKPIIRSRDVIVPVGFAAEEALLPWSKRGFSGFRLLTEYFAFPDKFMFFDLCELDAKTLASGGSKIEVFIYLDRALPELERLVNADAFALGCTPVVNLFPQRCEPIALSRTETEYRIVPDARRPLAMEVWSVERVRETRNDGSETPWRPFYRLAQGDKEASATGSAYLTVRRESGAGMPGTEIYLAPDEPALDPESADDAVLSIDAICTNRDLPGLLPFGGGQPRLRLVEGASAVTKLTALTSVTPTLRPPLREQGFWRLVSHLSLSHLSIVDGADGAAALREILRLYDFRDAAETRAAIDSLVAVTARPGAARVAGARPGAFCRGVDVTLEFDLRGWQVGGLYLLASVLDRFLALHATVNSFVRTGVVLRGRPGKATTWPARAGSRVLL